jgi:hypothetical protein
MELEAAQRVVLGLLLELHPSLLALDELSERLDLVQDELALAISMLCADGLVSLLGDRAGCTRAAVRFDVLTPV